MAVIAVVSSGTALTEFIYYESMIISINTYEENTLCYSNPDHRKCSNYCDCRPEADQS